MAFDSSELVQVADGNAHAFYIYKEDTDVRATVMASGYFNNLDDSILLRADDLIFVVGDEGGYILRVDTIDGTTGVVTTDLGGAPIHLATRFTDIGSTGSEWLVAPCDGIISRMWVITHATPGADTVIGLELANVDVTGCQVTVTATGGSAGAVFTGLATAANVVSEGDAIEIDTDAANTAADDATVIVEIIPA